MLVDNVAAIIFNNIYVNKMCLLMQILFVICWFST